MYKSTKKKMNVVGKKTEGAKACGVENQFIALQIR